MTQLNPVRMIRACAPSLAHDQLVTAVVDAGTTQRLGKRGANGCPSHDDVDAYLAGNATGSCLDTFWSQRYLGSLPLWSLLALWRSWRKAARP